MPEINVTQWQGEPLVGKSLIVWPEQGLGDEIQFVRYVYLLKKQQPKKIILVCRQPLQTLLSQLSVVDKVISQNDFQLADADDIDYWAFMMSFPFHLKTTLETVPANLPYLYACSNKQLFWKQFLPCATFVVGLVWKGNEKNANDCDRSIPSLQILKPLWNVSGVSFVSLQRDIDECDISVLNDTQPLVHLGCKIKDFSDTAAIISQLDLVIAVDTAVVHLAGALNTNCWVLLSENGTDWRWPANDNGAPWYPNVMRLFRQTLAGEWGDVMLSVEQALTEKLTEF